MARTHALSGAAAGVAVFCDLSVPLPAMTVGGLELPDRLALTLGVGQMNPAYAAIMCLALATAALLPDWDTASSYVSTCLPPVSQMVSGLIGRAGHRTLTHTPVGICLAGAVVAAAAAPTVMLSGVLVRPGNGLVLAVLAAVGARALGASSRLVLWGAGVMGLLWGASLPASALWFMPVAVVLGMWVHRVGDALTTRGVENPLWPLVRRPRVRLPLLGEAGSRREGALGALLVAYTAVGVVGLALSAWA